MTVSVFEAKRIFDLAARGDAGAQEFLYDAALHISDEPPEQSILQAEIWIRMAASQGRATARFKLGTLLSVQAARYLHDGKAAEAVDALAEAMAIYDRLAESGDTDADAALAHLLEATEVEGFRDAVVRRSKIMRGEGVVHG